MSTKPCSICKKEKELSEFNKKASCRDGLQTHCKDCSKQKFKEYYEVNREKCCAETIARNKNRRKAALQFVYDYLKANPCVDCGEKDPRCLEFDHVRGKKTKAISAMLRNNLCIETISDEIKKCDVRCANCHRKKTANDQNWYNVVDKGL